MPVKKIFVSAVACVLLGLFNQVHAGSPVKDVEITSDGVIIYPDINFSGNARAVRLQVINENIIRVTASPSVAIAERSSLVIVYHSAYKNWTVTKQSDRVILKTPSLTSTVFLSTGAVSFADKTGKPLLAEKKYNGRSLAPAFFEGQSSYGITQLFETTAGDAYYGLGQHQDGQFNYKGQQVSLFQNNTEVAVPFLISNKHYGILWDNYSLTKVGDLRSFHPLSALKLFSDKGQQGWLTATYYNDKNTTTPLLTRAESSINMEFLRDSRIYLPTEFKGGNGKVTWEGSIASDFTGLHKFRILYGGYIKLWIDGNLLLDNWRKAWNPAPALLDIPLKKNTNVSIKIEWIPEGTESYLSFKWQEPPPKEQENSYGFSSEAGQLLDYYFIYGKNMDETIGAYRLLTGKAPIVPKWALGFWQSRERYKTQDEILTTVAEFRKRKIPLDNIVLDWSYWKEAEWGSQDFDATRFPSPDSMISVLHRQYNTHFMISVWPKFYEGIAAYDSFDKKGWLYKRNIADRQRDWIANGYVSTFYDAFNEEARKGFWDLINKKIYSKGIDAWWMDASEPDILSNVSPEKRKQQMAPTAIGTAAENLNAYPLQNAKGIYEGQRSTDPNRRVFLLTRSGFAGSQRYAAAIWSGDIGSRWTDMKAQIPAGINFSMSGIPYWTMDIGGFIVERRFEQQQPDPADLEEWRELQTRWYQFGAFVPLFRVHGQFPYREMYNTAPEDHPAYKSMLYYNKLRYRLMPYIYSLAGMTYHNNYTIMRGLAMDFGTDEKVLSIGDQYMFGPSLLINPVYAYKQTKRSVYLPSTTGWYDLYTGKYQQGGETVQADAPYEKMPIYVKEGSILPFGPALQYTTEKPTDTLTLFVYTGKDASFTIYEDENTNYNYEKGAFSNIPLAYNEAKKQLLIGTRQGNFQGMLRDRIFQIVWVTKDRPEELRFDKENATTINYHGQAVQVSAKTTTR